MIGSTIGSYRITQLLGEGGMGAVYRATDNIEREVALKALHPQLTRDENRLQRFRSEAIALGRLHHPNIASLYHLLEQDGNFYMVMEYVEGQTLEDIVRLKGALPPRLAIDIFNDGLHGFEHAHTRGVIHRDIKPSNLMVSTDGVTKITDFGIARMTGGGRLTQTGKLIGTLEYMSPEQVRGLEQDARSDIYSLGILLFELLTGRVPFTATSDFDLMKAHLEQAPPPARYFVPSLPPEIDEIIAKALAKDPNARFENIAQMRAALESVAQTLPVSSVAPSQVTSPNIPANVVNSPNERSYATMPMGGPQVAGTPASAPTRIDSPQPQVNVPPTNYIPNPRPVNNNKWMIPVGAGMGALALLIVGVLAMGALRPKAQVEVIPTPTPIVKTNDSNRTTVDNTIDTIEIPDVKPTTAAPLPDIEIPDTIPGFNSDPSPNPTKARNIVPPTPPKTTTTTPIRNRERTTTITKQPSPRTQPRRAATSTPRRRERARVVEKPKPRRRVVREVVRSRPRPAKVATRPQRRPSSGGGGGERAALRALIKGN